MTLVSDKIFGTYMLLPQNNYMYKLENYQALLWWIFQTGKFLREKATLSCNTQLKWNIEVAHVEEQIFEWGTIFCEIAS